MPRTRADYTEANFAQGIISDVGPLQQPASSVKSMTNMELQKNGSLRVRNGFIPLSAPTPPYNSTFAVTSMYMWKNVGNSGSSIVLIQTDATVHAYLYNAVTVVSTLLISLDIKDFAGNTPTSVNRLQYLEVGNVLIAVGANLDPLLFKYDTSTSVLTMGLHAIIIRDSYGVEDTLSITDRPTTLSDEHKYNLLNSGWNMTDINAFKNTTSNTNNVYPSNTDYIWNGYRADPQNPSSSIKVFLPEVYFKEPQTTTIAPRGHYQMYLRNRDRQAVVAGLPAADPSGGPNTATFFAGRMWYGWFSNAELQENVYFSQTMIETDAGQSRIFHCCTQNDPTAKEVNDVLDDDGGMIKIPGCGGIFYLETLADRVIVFAANGVWSIGGAVNPFSANYFTVVKITDAVSLRKGGIVKTEESIYFLSDAGVIKLSPAGNNAILATDISSGRFYDFYKEAIPTAQALIVRSYYDFFDKKIYWVSQDGSMLIYDTVLGALSYYEINDPNIRRAGMIIPGGVLEGRYFWFFRGGVFAFCSLSGDDSGVYHDFIAPEYESYVSTLYPVSAEVILGPRNFKDLQRTKQVYKLTTYFESREKGIIPSKATVNNLDEVVPLTQQYVPTDQSLPNMAVTWNWSGVTGDPTNSRTFVAYRQPYLYVDKDASPLPAFQKHALDLQYINAGIELGFPILKGFIQIPDALVPNKKVVPTEHRIRGRGDTMDIAVVNSPGSGFTWLGWSANMMINNRP